MIILIILLIVFHIYLFIQRDILFYRLPSENDLERYIWTVKSPAEGKVVYIRRISITSDGKDFYSYKQGRQIQIPPSVKDGEYFHIGIYLSPYNNHHIVSPVKDPNIINIQEIGQSLLPMSKRLDSLFLFTRFKNWLDKYKDGFLEYNKRVVFEINDFYLIAIFDKYVSKYNLFENNKILAFIHRGSQVDLLMPVDNYDIRESLRVGDRVDFFTTIFDKKIP